MNRFERYREGKLKKLANVKPFVMASLCEVNRRCGNPRCKCAKGEPHRAHVLTYKVKGRTKAVHVPKEMVPEVKKWVAEYKQVKEFIKDISRHSLAILHNQKPRGLAAKRKK
jgi:hypothetical protein